MQYLMLIYTAESCDPRPGTEEGAQHLAHAHYEQAGREMRACHPRDLLELILDISRFFGDEPALSPDALDLACASYFVDLEEAA